MRRWRKGKEKKRKEEKRREKKRKEEEKKKRSKKEAKRVEEDGVGDQKMRSENKSEWGDDDEGRRENGHTCWKKIKKTGPVRAIIKKVNKYK